MSPEGQRSVSIALIITISNTYNPISGEGNNNNPTMIITSLPPLLSADYLQLPFHRSKFSIHVFLKSFIDLL